VTPRWSVGWTSPRGIYHLLSRFSYDETNPPSISFAERERITWPVDLPALMNVTRLRKDREMWDALIEGELI
jgi:hypothetical protein